MLLPSVCWRDRFALVAGWIMKSVTKQRWVAYNWWMMAMVKWSLLRPLNMNPRISMLATTTSVLSWHFRRRFWNTRTARETSPQTQLAFVWLLDFWKIRHCGNFDMFSLTISYKYAYTLQWSSSILCQCVLMLHCNDCFRKYCLLGRAAEQL